MRPEIGRTCHSGSRAVCDQKVGVDRRLGLCVAWGNCFVDCEVPVHPVDASPEMWHVIQPETYLTGGFLPFYHLASLVYYYNQSSRNSRSMRWKDM